VIKNNSNLPDSINDDHKLIKELNDKDSYNGVKELKYFK